MCKDTYDLTVGMQKFEMFPQEYEVKVPSVSFDLSMIQGSVAFNFDYQNVPIDAPQWKPIFSTKGDGFSRSFRILYTGGGKSK